MDWLVIETYNNLITGQVNTFFMHIETHLTISVYVYILLLYKLGLQFSLTYMKLCCTLILFSPIPFRPMHIVN